MATPMLVAQSQAESVFEIGKRLTTLLEQTELEAVNGCLPDTARNRHADTIEALRVRSGS